MRRMYSEQELTKIIGEVFDAKIEAGAFDDSISDAVDAYLVEHPVDITALEGKTIAPAVVNATTSVGAPSGTFTALQATSANIFENIKDSDGNARFIGGDLTENATSGITHLYKKWSLSGTHLMIVDVFKIASGTSLTAYSVPSELALPEWVGAKIYPIGTTSDWIVFKSAIISKASGAPASETSSTLLRKLSDTSFQLYLTDAITASEDIYVRLQFDLLVDNQ